MSDKIVKGSRCGEVRIEAQMKEDDTVSFRLFYLNTRQGGFDLDNEPRQNFSIGGLNAYFINFQTSLKRFLDDYAPFETPKIMREIREDLLST